MTVCEQCGTRNSPGARFCVSCNAYLGWDETTTLGRVPGSAGPGSRGQVPTGQRPSGPPGGQGPGGQGPGGQGPAGPPADRKPGRAVPAPGPQEAGVRLDLAGTAPAVLPLGSEHRLTATVRNTGSLVDEVRLGVEPRVGWIRVEPDRVSLFPGQEEEVTVVLAPPAVPAPPAGPLRYRVVARSALHPQVGAAADASVTVGAVDALAAYLEPVAVVAKGRATARVILRNDGNRTMPVTVFRADAEPGVRTDLVPGRLELWPARPAEVAVRLRPARLRWRGEPQRHGYRLRVQPHLGPPIDLDATLVQRPLFARWVLPLLLAIILAPLLAFGGIALAGVIDDLGSPGGPAVTDQPAGTEPRQPTAPNDSGQGGGGGGGGGTNPPTDQQTSAPPEQTTPPPEQTGQPTDQPTGGGNT